MGEKTLSSRYHHVPVLANNKLEDNEENWHASRTRPVLLREQEKEGFLQSNVDDERPKRC